MIAVKIASLSLSNMGFVVLLRSDQDERTLPIFIGAAEAQAIAIQLDQVQVPRPLTHDLFKNVLDCMECRLKRVVISDLVDSTFYALLVLDHDGVETEVDARPSDALALALRFSAPVFLAEKVMEQAGIVLKEEPGKKNAKGHAVPAPEASRQATSPLDALKRRLDEAIRDERYEEAAKLRDDIKRLEHGHGKN